MRKKHDLIMSAREGDKLAIALLDSDDRPWYIPDETRRLLISEAGSRCRICKRYTTEPHIDHIRAVAFGGKCFYDNLQVLCRFCNLSKSSHGLDPKSYEVGYVIPIRLDQERLVTKRILDILEDERY